VHNGRVRFTAALVITGCASFSSVQTADTLGRGRIQAAVEPGLWGAVSTQGPGVIPHVDGAVRFGVSDRVDLGVRAGMSFLEFQSKFQFTEPSNPLVAVSIAPTLGGLFTNGSSDGSAAGILNVALPVLIGVKFGGNQLVLGPRAQGFFIFANGNAVPIIAVGSSVGFMWRLTDNFGLMPEVAVLAPVVGANEAAMLFRGLNTGGAFVQFKVGILFGRMRPLDGDLRPRAPRDQQPVTAPETWEPLPAPPPPSL
jgi:hypothetical protein